MSRPVVRRTYGSDIKSQFSSSSLIFGETMSSSAHRSSSPFASSILVTPPPSSPPLDIEDRSEDSSPLFPEASGSDVQRAAVKGTLRGFFTPLPRQKRPLQPSTTIPAVIPHFETSSLSSSTRPGCDPSSSKAKRPQLQLTQLHLTHLPLMHTCKECSMSFIRGGADEGLHEKHHSRVVRGILWDGLGRKRKGKAEGWRVMKDDVRFGDGRGRGKVVMCDGALSGHKLVDILSTVDTVLSAPPLLPTILTACRIFLLITASPPPARSGKRPRLTDNIKQPKERIVGVVVAQVIKWAMRVLRPNEEVAGDARMVDSGGGVVCDPTPLPTPLGIHRLFTIPSYRSLGLAQVLLDAACETMVYGCAFNPHKGEVAFSQPTQSGRAVMEKWGGGGVRVFVDDESQLQA